MLRNIPLSHLSRNFRNYNTYKLQIRTEVLLYDVGIGFSEIPERDKIDSVRFHNIFKIITTMPQRNMRTLNTSKDLHLEKVVFLQIKNRIDSVSICKEGNYAVIGKNHNHFT